MRELGLDKGGWRCASCRVRVGDGFTTTTAAATLTVTNAAPTGALANRTVAEGTTATIGLTVVTDASPGDVTAGLRYAYDFQAHGTYDVGSTTYAQASTATTADLPAALTADGPGTRNVRVAVVDRDGGFTPYNATVTVTNTAPSATLANNGPVGEGTTAQVPGLALTPTPRPPTPPPSATATTSATTARTRSAAAATPPLHRSRPSTSPPRSPPITAPSPCAPSSSTRTAA